MCRSAKEEIFASPPPSYTPQSTTPLLPNSSLWTVAWAGGPYIPGPRRRCASGGRRAGAAAAAWPAVSVGPWGEMGDPREGGERRLCGKTQRRNKWLKLFGELRGNAKKCGETRSHRERECTILPTSCHLTSFHTHRVGINPRIFPNLIRR